MEILKNKKLRDSLTNTTLEMFFGIHGIVIAYLLIKFWGHEGIYIQYNVYNLCIIVLTIFIHMFSMRYNNLNGA